MEIRQLTFTAFGPFTDRPALSFASANGRFHVIHGPNEAGKSSALRALKALLYGIDERTPDNFIHANEHLRIGGCLGAKNGSELTFIRRKGRKNTLLDTGGKPLDEDTLASFLNGVPVALFEMLFGIDHRALVQGGEDILAQRGDVGQALFSASLGSHNLHAVLAELDAEAEALFKPRGSTPPINAAIKTHRELTKEIKDCALSSKEWEDNRRALNRASRDLRQIHTDLADNRVEINRLKRIQRCAPRLAKREELKRQIAARSDVAVLADDFGQRHRRAAAELDKARSTIDKTNTRIEGYIADLAGLALSQSVLDESENIEALHAQLGAHRKALRDKPHLKAEYEQLTADINQRVKDVRPDLEPAAIETLRPALAQRMRVSALGNRHPELVSQLKAAGRSHAETKRKLRKARQDAEALPLAAAPERLRTAITQARKNGNLDDLIQSTRDERDTAKARCEADLARLPLWTGSLKALRCLKAPSQETVCRFEDRYAKLDRHEERLQEKQREAADAVRETTGELDAITRGGAVPSESELAALRGERDQLWQLVRRQWLDGGDVDTVAAKANALDADRGLPEAFEHRLHGADDLADRLRREADRVRAQAQLSTKQAELAERAAEIARQLEQSAANRKQIDGQWQALWGACGIQPQTPREMRAWLEKLGKLQEAIDAFYALQRQVTEREDMRAAHLSSIQKEVAALGQTIRETVFLDTALTDSEAIAREQENIRWQRASLDETIRTLEQQAQTQHSEHQAAVDDLKAWKAQWAKAVAALGLDADALPQQAAEVLDELKDLFAKQGDAEKLKIRIDAIDNDAQAFEQQAAALAARIAPELQALPAEEAVNRLNVLLSDNKHRQSRRGQIKAQLEQAREDNRAANDTVKDNTARQDKLCAEAGCADPADLEAAEHRSNEKRQLETELANLERSILDSGEGATLAELLEQAQQIDPDTLPAKIDALSHTIDDELEPRRTTLAETKGGLDSQRERMDGTDRAAALADRAQCVVAEIRADSERYVRVKLAARILRDEIERYREQNQGPLIKRASAHFAALTLGSFDALHTDFNDKDEPLLVGVRPNRDKVKVEGMSSGTRDQLYLALRLASLEKYMENTEPMPFIVDDILVDFDDERCQAALDCLARLSEKTQVILFTHHANVVAQAQKLKPARAQIHAL